MITERQRLHINRVADSLTLATQELHRLEMHLVLSKAEMPVIRDRIAHMNEQAASIHHHLKALEEVLS